MEKDPVISSHLDFELSQRKTASTGYLTLFSTPLAIHFYALLAYLILLMALRFELVMNMNSVYYGGSQKDAALYIWLFKEAYRSLLVRNWFDTNAFFPYGYSLAWSDNFILPSLVGAPLLFAGLSETLAYNLVLLAAVLLNGYCTFRLCFLLTGSRRSSFVSGAVFLALSYINGQAGHPQLLFAFFLPLTVELLCRYVGTRQLRYSFLLGLTVFATFLCSVYYFVFAALLLFGLSLAFVCLNHEVFSLSDFLGFSASLLLGVAPVIPFALPYFKVAGTFGERELYEPYYFAADIFSFLSAHPLSLLYSKTGSLAHAEAHLFPGILLYAAALGCVIWIAMEMEVRKEFFLALFLTLATGALSSKTFASDDIHNFVALLSWLALFANCYLLYQIGAQERLVRSYALPPRALAAAFLFVAAFAFLLSLGPIGNASRNESVVGVFRVFYEYFPGFTALRAISRLGLVALFGLLIASSIFFAHILRNAKFSWVAFCLLLSIFLVENLHSAYPREPAYGVPPVLSSLAAQNSNDDAAVFLPFTDEIGKNGTVKHWGEYALRNTLYMNWSSKTEHPIVNGYSGLRSKIMREFPRKFSHFPDRRSLNTLSSVAGLRYIAYFPFLDPGYEEQRFLSRLSEFADELRLIERDGYGNFLFEYVGHRTLPDSFSLLAPAYTAGTLYFELRIPRTKQPSIVTIGVKQELDTQVELLASFSVPAEGVWETYSVAIPKTGIGVAPRRISFDFPDGQRVDIRKHRFIAAPAD